MRVREAASVAAKIFILASLIVKKKEEKQSFYTPFLRYPDFKRTISDLISNCAVKVPPSLRDGLS